MNAVLSSLGKEIKLVFRNGISLFMALAPAILAIVFILIFGATQGASLKLAVHESVDAASLQNLSTIADIELFSDENKLQSRIRATDAVAGITLKDGTPVLVFAGDEGDDFMTGTHVCWSKPRSRVHKSLTKRKRSSPKAVSSIISP